MGCVEAEGEGERDVWCWWNCKYQPSALSTETIPTSAGQFYSYQESKQWAGTDLTTEKISQLSAASALLSTSISSVLSQSQRHSENPGPANNFHTKLTGLWKITPDRFAFIISMIDRSQNRLQIFCWGVKSQHTWLGSDSIRIGIIQG